MNDVTSETELTFRIAGTDVTVRGPQPVLAVVDQMLAQVDRTPDVRSASIVIDVSSQSGVWSIVGQAPASRKTLGNGNALPQIAGAVVSSILAEISHHRNVVIWRASVVEREGRALAFIGDDWESCITLAAHLHTRGWNFLGGDYALIGGDTLVVSAFRKVLHANSSCVGSFPSWYRRAIEASPWYSMANAIAFYAIDPRLVQETSPWGDDSRLGAVLKVDGCFDEHPSLQAVEDMSFPGSLSAEDLKREGVEVANLIVGDFIETCDLLDRWFASVAITT